MGPSLPRQALSFRQRGKHIAIAVHEGLPAIDLLLHPGIERGDRISAGRFDRENLLPFLGMEMPEHFLGQDKADGSADFPKRERNTAASKSRTLIILVQS